MSINNHPDLESDFEVLHNGASMDTKTNTTIDHNDQKNINEIKTAPGETKLDVKTDEQHMEELMQNIVNLATKFDCLWDTPSIRASMIAKFLNHLSNKSGFKDESFATRLKKEFSGLSSQQLWKLISSALNEKDSFLKDREKSCLPTSKLPLFTESLQHLTPPPLPPAPLGYYTVDTSGSQTATKVPSSVQENENDKNLDKNPMPLFFDKLVVAQFFQKHECTIRNVAMGWKSSSTFKKMLISGVVEDIFSSVFLQAQIESLRQNKDDRLMRSIEETICVLSDPKKIKQLLIEGYDLMKFLLFELKKLGFSIDDSILESLTSELKQTIGERTNHDADQDWLQQDSFIEVLDANVCWTLGKVQRINDDLVTVRNNDTSKVWIISKDSCRLAPLQTHLTSTNLSVNEPNMKLLNSFRHKHAHHRPLQDNASIRIAHQVLVGVIVGFLVFCLVRIFF